VGFWGVLLVFFFFWVLFFDVDLFVFLVSFCLFILWYLLVFYGVGVGVYGGWLGFF